MKKIIGVIFMVCIATNAHAGFPGVGKKVRVDFGTTAFDLSFHDDKTMSFVGISGEYLNATDTVKYTATEIRDGLYMVYWSEPMQKTNVVHIEDYKNNRVWTNISAPDGSFTHLSGILKITGDL